MAVAGEAGELGDHRRWVANVRAMAALDDARAGAEGEAADVMILLLEFASVCGIDIARAMARNSARYPVDLARGRASRARGWRASGRGGDLGLQSFDPEPCYAATFL